MDTELTAPGNQSGNLVALSPSAAECAFAAELDRSGLNLFSALGVLRAHQTQAPTPRGKAASHPACDRPVAERWLLIGAAGARLWQHVDATATGQTPDPYDDPIDTATVQAVAAAIERLPAVPGPREYQLLYPLLPAATLATLDIPDMLHCVASDSELAMQTSPALQDLGSVAGWHSKSPLGIGMHPQAGLWFSYRALIRVGDPPTPPAAAADLPAGDICQRCVTQACINACPAQALTLSDSPDMHACVASRLLPDSDCASQCLARKACPEGARFRYAEAQLHYHYNFSLAAIKRYRRDASD